MSTVPTTPPIEPSPPPIEPSPPPIEPSPPPIEPSPPPIEPRVPTEPEAAAAPLPPSDPQAQLGQAFKGAMGAVRRLRGRETRQLGLSYAQYGLLFGLEQHESELSASQLAVSADLAPGTVTQMLDHLEDDGLVRRTRSVRDKRVVLVSLTERGHELVAQRRAALEGRWLAALEGVSDDELLTAAAVLDRLHAMFDRFEEDDSPT